MRQLSADSEPATAASGPAPAGAQPASTVDASPLNLMTDPLLREFIDYG